MLSRQVIAVATTFLNQNSQPLTPSTFSNSPQSSSASSNSNENQTQNKNGQTTASATDFRNPSKAQIRNRSDSQNAQSFLSNALKSPKAAATIVTISASIFIVLVGLAIFCFGIRRQRKKSPVQLHDGTRRGFESERGASDVMGSRDGDGDASVGVFVTASEKFKELKKKTRILHVKEDDRISRDFEGALGGGMYLEGGTMGRELLPLNGGGGLSGKKERGGVDIRDTRYTSSNIHKPLPPIFNNPRPPPLPALPPLPPLPALPPLPPLPPLPSLPSLPLQPLQSRDSNPRTSQISFTSVTSGSCYSRATTGEPLQIPIQMDVPVPYRPSPLRNEDSYEMSSREKGQGLGLERGGGQRQDQPRGFF
ncbi:hypothetical protein NHQ30_000992 [Ciborinia camelliae]|nr:hypothetical protein NHQ30_000992 [Ciborinia camelliae]